LAIEENARFEGTSRRQENAIDTPSRVPQFQVVPIDGNRKGKRRTWWSQSVSQSSRIAASDPVTNDNCGIPHDVRSFDYLIEGAILEH